MSTENKKLPMKTVVGYGVGDFALNLGMMSISFWLLYFYTDVFGLDGASAGFIFLVARIWDAVTDPGMGTIADRTKSRWGKFRPHILIFNIPLALITIAMFYTPSFGATGKFYYALVTYLLFNTFFTAVNIPYGALSASLTRDSVERTKLAAFRTFFAVLAGAIVAILTPYLIRFFDSERAGYTAVMAIYAIFQTILLVVVFFASAHETPGEDKVDPALDFKTSMKIVFQNGPFLILCGAIFTGMCATTIRNSAIMYYFKYFLNRPDLVPWFSGAVVLSLLAGIGITQPLAKKIGKRKAFLVATGVAIPANILFYFTENTEILRAFITCSVAAVGGGIVFALMWSMVPDTVEYGEWKTGARGEGIIYGVYGFVQKFAMAIGGIAGGRYLDYVGYVPNAEQTPRAVRGILHEFILFPLVTTIIATAIMYFYTLDSDKFEKIKEEISRRKASA